MRNLILALLCTATVGGCSPPNEYKEPPPPSVTVAPPLVRTVTNYLEETGATVPVERVEIRARVRGILQEVNFTDGQEVKKGDPLYLIQPQEYVAKVAAAEADVALMNVALSRAKIEVERETNLLKDNATAQSNVDTAIAARDGAIASLDAAAASLSLAKLDLEYTAITAPFDGRVERTLVRQGNLVGGSEETLLTTMIKYDPIFVYFNISERALLLITNELKAEPGERIDLSKFKVRLRRTTDKDFPFEGQLDYADLGVDQSTGTFTVRAKFPNPDRLLLPGLFVRIRVPLGTIENAILVPERSVGADQAGRYVMVVGEKNLVERRNVTLGTKFGEMVVAMEGLDGTEKVVIDGLQRARPGASVSPTEIVLEAPAELQGSATEQPSVIDAAKSAAAASDLSQSLPPSDASSQTEKNSGEAPTSTDSSATPSEK